MAQLCAPIGSTPQKLPSSDLITDDAILGCPVPDAARPILRAIKARHELVLEIPWSDASEPREAITDQDNPMEMPPANERDFAAALGLLLHGRKG